MTKTAKPKNDKSIQVYAALAVGLVCIVIGVPMWWKTTEVYRVQLPYSDIEELSNYKLQYRAGIIIACLTSKDCNAETLAEAVQKTISNPGTSVIGSYKVQSAKAISTDFAQLSLSDLDHHFSGLSSAGAYYVVIVPASYPLPVPITVGIHRNIFIQQAPEHVLIEKISHTMRDVVIRHSALENSQELITGSRQLKADKETLRSVKSSPGYDITLTLVNPQPGVLDVQWDVENGINTYLQPFLSKLEEFINVTLNSQVLYFSGLVIRPQSKNGEYHFRPEDLPHMINPLETKLGSHASNNPTLNFIVYIPTKDQSPLYITDSQGRKVPSNSFLSPRWGGMLIMNIPSPTNTPLPVVFDLDMREVMQAFLTQLRLLLHIQSQTAAPGVFFTNVGNNGVADWELDFWLRLRCIENLATSVGTLQSLSKLLGKINNMIINDEVGQEVTAAIQFIIESRGLLATGSLAEAFLKSKSAMIASEKAFFDSSLLELLYFPEDQKFAIYIPLFLPISFPVIMSVVKAIKWMRNRKEEKQD